MYAHVYKIETCSVIGSGHSRPELITELRPSNQPNRVNNAVTEAPKFLQRTKKEVGGSFSASIGVVNHAP